MRTIAKLKYLVPMLARVKWFILAGGLITIASSTVALVPPYVGKLMFDQGVVLGDIGVIFRYGMLAFVAYLLNSILIFAEQALFSTVSGRFLADLKGQVTQRLLHMPIAFFDKNRTGYVTQRIQEVEHLSMFVSPALFGLLGSIVQFLGALLIMYPISSLITTGVLLLVPVLFGVNYLLNVRLRHVTADMLESDAQMLGGLQETISGVAEIKQSTAEDIMAKDVARQFSHLAGKQIAQSILLTLGISSIGILSHAIQVGVMVACGVLIVRGEMSIGGYVALTGYVGRLIAPAETGASLAAHFQPAVAALARLQPIFEEKTERDLAGKLHAARLDGAISFENVTFRYSDGKEPVLKNCCFAIPPAGAVAILGRNGAGKSTAIKLMLGFYPNYDGRILVDGHELRDYDVVSLRQRVGVVSQHTTLFSGSLWDNVKMANYEATDREVQQALALSGCRDVFFGELSTLQVAEAGKNMSGGQRQAVAIARCLLKDPDVLIFDEGTAHLDSTARSVVKHALTQVFPGKTRILITHDPEVAQMAKTIFVLEDGNVTISNAQ